MRRLEDSVPFRGGGFAPRDLPLAGAVTLVGLVALWQLGDSLGLIPTLFLPSPANIARALYHLTVSGELWKHLGASLARLCKVGKDGYTQVYNSGVFKDWAESGGALEMPIDTRTR